MSLLAEQDVRSHSSASSKPLSKPFSSARSAALETLLVYGITMVVCVVALIAVYRLDEADLRVPLIYKGDSIQVGAWFKATVEHGWYLHNPDLAMPFGQDMHDFPMADALHFAVAGLLGRLCGHWVIAYNLYYLATFVLCAWTALFVFRRFGIAAPFAAAAAVLFAFLPYHFFRGQQHYCLSAYYLVPLMVLLALRLYQGQPPLVRRELDDAGRREPILSLKSFAVAALCLAAGAAGVYYAFFGCFFLLVAAAANFVAARQPRVLVSAGVMIGLMVGSLAVQATPTILYRAANGRNLAAIERLPAEAEIFGLRIAQMLLPIKDHRWPLFADLEKRFAAQPRPSINENQSTALGLAGSAGFLWLLTRMVLGRRNPSSGRRFDDGLVALNTAALLLATMGGVGALLSLFGLTWIRAYNRIGVFIGFFSFFALAFLLTRALARCRQWGVSRGLSRGAAIAVSVALVALGIADQCPLPDEQVRRGPADFVAEAAFVDRIEQRLPAGAMIFQLPLVGYVEHAPLYKQRSYDSMRPYLHSRTLRWSYGAMRGRFPAFWQEQVHGLPADRMVETLATTGFAGVWVDRFGYIDDGAAIEKELTRLAGPALVSDDGRYAFFNLERYTAELSSRWTAAELHAKRRDALDSVVAVWNKGFWEPISIGDIPSVRFCGPEAELILLNPSDQSRTGTLAVTGYCPIPTKVEIDGALGEHAFAVHDRREPALLPVTIPPGQHVVRLRCDGLRISAPGDQRDIRFGMISVVFRPTE